MEKVKGRRHIFSSRITQLIQSDFLPDLESYFDNNHHQLFWRLLLNDHLFA